MNFTWWTYSNTFVRAEAFLQQSFKLLDMEDEGDRAIMWRRTHHLMALLHRAGRENVQAPPRFVARWYMKQLNKKYGLTEG